MLSNFSKYVNMSLLIQKRILIKTKFSYIKPKKKPVAYNDPFQYQQQKINESTKKAKTKYGYLQFGMYGLVFACCFAGIPLYRVFCEHVGLLGNYDKKTYQFKEDKVKNMKKYTVKFEGQPQPGIDWQFQPVQQQVIISPSQTAIVFYRLYNKEDKPIVGFSTYNITPEEANIYFSKIQCFCFNQQMVNPKQQLLLPIFFYLQPELADDPDVGRIRQIKVHYDFIRSNKQDLAEFAQAELKRVEQNKKKLKQIRAKKKNMTIDQYQNYIHEEEIKEQRKLHTQLDENISAVRQDGTINIQILNPVQSKRIDHLKNEQQKTQLNKVQNKHHKAQQIMIQERKDQGINTYVQKAQINKASVI